MMGPVYGDGCTRKDRTFVDDNAPQPTSVSEAPIRSRSGYAALTA